MDKISKALEKAGYLLNPDKADSASSGAGGERVQYHTLPPAQEVGQPEVSQLPAGSGKWDDRLTLAVNSSGAVAESFRVLRSKILMPQDGRKVPKTIMVTSVLPQEGKSFVTANLGITLAHAVDQYSLLVDCDLRLPTLARLFGISHDCGLSDYLLKKTDIATLIKKTSMEKLSLLASGIPPNNPAELLGSARMHQLVAELSSRYQDRFVIFDSPPLQVASEAMVLSQVVDGVVLVVRHGFSNLPLIKKAIEDVGKQKIIGVIFNGYETNIVTSRFINKSYSYYDHYYQSKTQ